MAVVVPYLTVPAPVRTPQPFGLFSVVTPSSPSDPHWQSAGAQFTELSGKVSGRGDTLCYTDNADPDAKPVGIPKTLDLFVETTSAWTPFTVFATRTCTPGAGKALDDLQNEASTALLEGEEKRVEQAAWTGDLGNKGFAADAEKLGTGVSPVRAMALLEGWIADNLPGQGVIHLTRSAATFLARKDVITISGSSARTTLGTPVVIGSGYPGSAPDGTAAAEGSEWAYATGPLVVLRSEVFTSTGPGSTLIDTSVNDLTAVAERTYLVGWSNTPDNDHDTAAINFVEEDS